MADSWQCPVCETINDARAVTCVVCQASNPAVASGSGAAGIVAGQGGRGPEDPANVAEPPTVSMYRNPSMEGAPGTSAPAPAPAPAAGAPASRSRALVIGLVVLVVLLGGAVVFLLSRGAGSDVGAGSTTTTVRDTTTRPRPTDGGGGVSGSAPQQSTTGLSAPPESATVLPVTTTTVPLTPPTVTALPTTSTPPPVTVGPTTGRISGTCDAGSSCGVKQRSAPAVGAGRLYPNDLDEGQTIAIECQTQGEAVTNKSASGGGPTSTLWYRMMNGSYVSSVYVVDIAAVPDPCV